MEMVQHCEARPREGSVYVSLDIDDRMRDDGVSGLFTSFFHPQTVCLSGMRGEWMEDYRKLTFLAEVAGFLSLMEIMKGDARYLNKCSLLVLPMLTLSVSVVYKWVCFHFNLWISVVFLVILVYLLFNTVWL